MFNRTFNSLSIITLISVALLLANTSCSDPEDYNPQIQKIPSPDPPDIIKPLPDTVICEGPVIFDWTVPAGSEVFQIQADTNPYFNTASMFQVGTPAISIFLDYGVSRITYYARIRAGSSQWSDYTVWSDIRRFYLWQES